MSISGGPDVIENGLILTIDTLNVRSYISGSTVWNDITANNNSGSLTGITLVQSPFGFQFGTGNSFVTMNNVGNLTFTTASQFSLSIWTQLDTGVTASATNNSACAFAAGSFVGSVGIGFAFGRNVNGDTASFAYSARPVGGSDFAYYHPISLGRIYNATMVFSGSTIYGYLDGTLVGSQAVTTGTTFSTNWSMFTNSGIPGGNNFKPQGKMYYASAYNRALTPQEVLQNFNAQRSRFGI